MLIEPSANDFEARRTIWDSKIPVEFVLESSESVLDQQQACFLMLPRTCYFPVFLNKPLNVLTGGNVNEEEIANAWIQYDGTPLKWHYPIGVLYDILVRDQTTPWKLTVRLKYFPPELIRCRATGALKFCFLQSLKEACQLKYRQNIVGSMTKDEHSKIFESLSNDRFNDFWAVNEKIMHLESSFTKENNGGIEKLPVRFYETSGPFRQFPITSSKLVEGELVDTLLIDALKKAFPEYQIDTDYEAVTHGIVIPFETPMIWLVRNLSYPDSFVHIILRLKMSK